MTYIREFDHSKNDLDFLTDMIYEAIYIPENKPPKEELLNHPDLKKYSEGWGRQGDRALIAVNSDHFPVGAAWYRLFTEKQKGYGYVNDKTPELGIALTNEARGRGIGSLLMEKLIEAAARDGYPSLSLSVDQNNNRAVEFYKKFGFKIYDASGTSWTMIYHIPPNRIV